MEFYGKTQDIANGLLEQFRSGYLPKPLALVFLRHADDLPFRKRSWSNQLLTAIAGHSDARGFRQWQDVGRAVRKGEHAFHILVPVRRGAGDDACAPGSEPVAGRGGQRGLENVSFCRQ